MRTATILLLLALCWTNRAPAGDTIAVYVDVGEGLSRFSNVGVGFLDIVVMADFSLPAGAMEFVITELRLTHPDLYLVDIRRYDDSELDIGDNARGEYLMALGGCVPPGLVEVLRISYIDPYGLIGPDTVVSLRGFQPGDSQPSSFDGEIGYVDCTNILRSMTLEPWSEYGMPDNDDLAGAAVLNPTWMPVGGTAISLGCVKARY